MKENWISVKDRLPPLSYVESDNVDDAYEGIHFLLFTKEDVCVVGYLVQNQDKDDWNFGEYTWEIYIPCAGGLIEELDFDKVTYWMPLPKPPKKE